MMLILLVLLGSPADATEIQLSLGLSDSFGVLGLSSVKLTDPELFGGLLFHCWYNPYIFGRCWCWVSTLF